MSDNKTDKWHINKSIPLALLFTMFIQVMGLTWWAAGVNFQVNQNKHDLEVLRSSHEKVLRMEAIMEGVLIEVRELRSDLKKLSERNH